MSWAIVSSDRSDRLGAESEIIHSPTLAYPSQDSHALCSLKRLKQFHNLSSCISVASDVEVFSGNVCDRRSTLGWNEVLQEGKGGTWVLKCTHFSFSQISHTFYKIKIIMNDCGGCWAAKSYSQASAHWSQMPGLMWGRGVFIPSLSFLNNAHDVNIDILHLFKHAVGYSWK